MANNQSAVVPGDTDDLDAFSNLLVGKATEPKEEETDTETAENEAETEVDETEENAETSDAAEDESEDSDDSEAAEEGDAGEDDEGSKPTGKKNRVQERIDELTAQRKAAERATEEEHQKSVALERRLQELEAKLSQRQEDPNQQAKTQTGPSPDDKAEDGSDKYPLGELDPGFIRDLTRFTIKQENEVERVRNEERQRADVARQAQVKLDEEWTERVTKVEASLPKYKETVKTMLGTFESVDPAYGNYLASTIKSMDHGPEVLYYLSNNLPEARKIVESGAVMATIALGRLEAQFSQQSAAEKKPTKKVTKAAEPPKTVRGNGGRFAVAADTDDLDAFEKTFLSKK